MPFGGQICPEPAFFRARIALGPAMRRFNGTSQGFQAAHLVGPTSGISFFSGTPGTAWEFLLCFPRGLVQEKKSVRFSCVLGEKTMLLRVKQLKKNRVRRKSLRKPVACVYYKLPTRGRARWTENHPPRPRGTMFSSRELAFTASALRPRPALMPLASYTVPASSQAAMSSRTRSTISHTSPAGCQADAGSTRRRRPFFHPTSLWAASRTCSRRGGE